MVTYSYKKKFVISLCVNCLLVLYIKYMYQRSYLVPLEFHMVNTNNANSAHCRLTDKSQAIRYVTEARIFKILYWTSSNLKYYKNDNWLGVGKDLFKSCKFSNCLATTNKQELLTSDAVLFHLEFLKSFPTVRLPDQKWIMHILESPINVDNYHQYNGRFNATWTYDRASDIWTNSSHIEYVKGGLFVKNVIPSISLMNRNYAQGRSKLVAWFVSHCQTESKRMEYVRHLKNYVDVDIYGRCGTMYCGHFLNESNLDCLNMLKKEYKFYLSFENSLCDDYVTEKLWKAIYADVVPVVLGAYNYSELMAPNSYIDIKDFASPKELAEYLIMLDGNDELYNNYFSWKGVYEIVRHPPMQCNLCEYLNVAQDDKKTYDRLDLFWNPNTKCYDPTEFYENVNKSSWT